MVVTARTALAELSPRVSAKTTTSPPLADDAEDDDHVLADVGLRHLAQDGRVDRARDAPDEAVEAA